MASKRRYPIQRCVNPACGHPYFEPHDKRQRYCTDQCRTNYNNDRRSKKTKNIKEHLKETEEKSILLGVAYSQWGYDKKPFEASWLTALGIDLSIASKESGLKSGKEVYWFNDYGLQPLNKRAMSFKIHCRNNF